MANILMKDDGSLPDGEEYICRLLPIDNISSDTHLKTLQKLKTDSRLVNDKSFFVGDTRLREFLPGNMGIGETYILTWFILSKASPQIVAEVLSMNLEAARWKDGGCFHLACTMGCDEIAELLLQYYPEAIIKTPTVVRQFDGEIRDYPCVFFIVSPLCQLSWKTKLKFLKAYPYCLGITAGNWIWDKHPERTQRLPVNEVHLRRDMVI